MIRPSSTAPDYRRNVAIAQRISEYWAERGYSVSPRIVAEGFHASAREGVYGIRSDMIGGLPARKIGGGQ